jgi:hypothetical protein
MGFESVVLAKVREVLVAVPSYQANFVNGTLFVECSVRDAVRLETALLEKLRCGIILSRVGDESAFDFV